MPPTSNKAKKAAEKNSDEQMDVDSNDTKARELRPRKKVNYTNSANVEDVEESKPAPKSRKVTNNDVSTEETNNVKGRRKKKENKGENDDVPAEGKVAKKAPKKRKPEKGEEPVDETEVSEPQNKIADRRKDKKNKEDEDLSDKEINVPGRMTYVVSEKDDEETKDESGDVKKENAKSGKKDTRKKPAARGKGKNAKAVVVKTDALSDTEVSAIKTEEEETESEPQGKKTESKLNRTESDFSDQEFDCNKSTPDGKTWNLKIASWNVDGLRAWIKKDGLKYIDHEKPDILCLQETKCSESKLPPEAKVEGYHCYWFAAKKEGYSGVALLSKEEPLSIKLGMDIEEHDSEGRLITAEYKAFYLVSTYVPNAGRSLVTLPKRMQWDSDFRKYLNELDAKKPVILCGDLNVSHKEIDLANPKTNTKNAGFTKEEREGMTELLSQGFIDTFRHFYPEQTGAYTFWTYMGGVRARNVGWRLDYFIVSEKMIDQVCDSVIRSKVYGSDHCPITLFIHV